MWRLADSVFFHMQAQTRVWHGIDASQLFWLLSTVALEDDDAVCSQSAASVVTEHISRSTRAS